MRKNFYTLIAFVLSKKTNSEKLIYLFKLIMYIIPLMYALSKNNDKESSSASQAGDDIYPIF